MEIIKHHITVSVPKDIKLFCRWSKFCCSSCTISPSSILLAIFQFRLKFLLLWLLIANYIWHCRRRNFPCIHTILWLNACCLSIVKGFDFWDSRHSDRKNQTEQIEPDLLFILLMRPTQVYLTFKPVP